MHNKLAAALLTLAGILSAPTEAPARVPMPRAADFSSIPAADVARLKARTFCSCLFVQKMSLQQCSDGTTEIWRYLFPKARVPLLDSPSQHMDVDVDADGGSVRLRDGDRILAQSRYLSDGGGCVTLPPDAAPDAVKPAAAARGRLERGDSERLPRDPSPPGVDLKLIEQALDEGFSPTGPMLGVTRAVVVATPDRVVADRYATGFSARNQYYLGSVSKVFANLLAGLLVQDGRLKVSDRVSVPQWQSATRDERSRITYDQLLKMVSGLAWEENFFATSHPGYQVFFAGPASLDVAAYMRAKPLEAKPGKHFEYSTGSATLLASLLQAKLDSPGRESLLDYFDRKLFAPIGARQITPEFDAAGTYLAGYAAFSGAEDLARIGMLLLNDGTVNGHRLLPEGWVKYSLQSPPALAKTPEYGALMMTDESAGGLPGCFGHEGVGTQWLIVCPKRSLVIVWLSSDFNFTLDGWTEARSMLRKIHDAFPEKPMAAK